MRRHEIDQSADKRQAKRACQRRKHVEPPKFAMAQPKSRLPFRNRRGYEIRLTEAGKVREHESAGDPTEVAPYEYEQGIFIWLYLGTTAAIGAQLSDDFALLPVGMTLSGLGIGLVVGMPPSNRFQGPGNCRHSRTALHALLYATERRQEAS